jgi:hypothetical protein
MDAVDLMVTGISHGIAPTFLQFRDVHVLQHEEKHGDIVGAIILGKGNGELSLLGIIYLGIDLVLGICVEVSTPVITFYTVSCEFNRFEAVISEPAVEIFLELEHLLIEFLNLAPQGTMIAFLSVDNGRIQLQGGLGDIGVDRAQFVMDSVNEILSCLEGYLILREIEWKAGLSVSGMQGNPSKEKYGNSE